MTKLDKTVDLSDLAESIAKDWLKGDRTGLNFLITSNGPEAAYLAMRIVGELSVHPDSVAVSFWMAVEELVKGTL